MFERVSDPKSSSYILGYIISENETSFRKVIFVRIFILFFTIFKVEKRLLTKSLMFVRVSNSKSSSYTLSYIMCEKGTSFRKLFFLTNFLIIFNIFKVQKPLYSKILMFKRVSNSESSSYTLGYTICENGT